MTIIVRKDNIIATDSLIFNGRPESPSIQYENKIKKNKSGTMVLAYSGNNFNGNLAKTLDSFSNILYLSMLNDKLVTIKDIPVELLNEINSLSENDTDFCIGFFSKKNTYIIKGFKNKPFIYHHKYDELVYLGSGSEILSNTNIKNLLPVELVQLCIKTTSTCNGNINVFNLNNLNEITLT